LDFSFRAYANALTPDESKGSDESKTWLSDLLLDCDVLDLPLLERTFWLGAEAKPRCALESLAKAVFELHTADLTDLDRGNAGCEYWAQVRKEEGRKAGIGAHWDKDETMRAKFGINVFPQISTVTYLGAAGAPTMVFPKRLSPEGLFLLSFHERCGLC
jgi:hypothetical protein